MESVHNKLKKIQCIIQSKASTAAGPDNIGGRVILETKTILAQHLVTLFERSFEIGIVPQKWKIASVTAIYKKCSKSDPRNYRGVSVTSLIGKICKRIIGSQIIEYVTSNKLISSTQHGFLPK